MSHTLVLEDSERALQAPEELQHRVDSQTYTWRLLFADHDPEVNRNCGRIGDVWVNKAAEQENVWIKTEGHSWNVWHKTVNYGTKRWNNSPLKFKHSFHPWLQDRHLQFTGTTLGWYPRHQYRQHRSLWSTDNLARTLLTYDELDAPWIARHISSLALPAMPDGPVNNHSLTLSSAIHVEGGYQPSVSASEPYSVPSIAPCTNADTCPSDIVAIHEPGPESSPSSSVSRIKRRRSVSSLEDAACKRARPHDGLSTRDPPPHIQLRPSTSAPALPPVPAPLPLPPPPPVLSGAFDLNQYLAALPLSLSKHTHIFSALGFTQRAYFDSIALMPKRLIDEVMEMLQERGLTFMETLVLRNTLNTVRRSASAQHAGTSAVPDSIRTFLAGLCPSLERRAPIFHELGIELAHLPVLSQLDAESYAEFEDTLTEADLTWVEVFLVRAGIKTFAGRQREPEPLLLAV